MRVNLALCTALAITLTLTNLTFSQLYSENTYESICKDKGGTITSGGYCWEESNKIGNEKYIRCVNVGGTFTADEKCKNVFTSPNIKPEHENLQYKTTKECVCIYKVGEIAPTSCQDSRCRPPM
jgi:hypothetical protein